MTLLSCSSAYQGAHRQEPPQLTTKHRGWEPHTPQEAGVVKRSMVGFTALIPGLRNYCEPGIFISMVCKNHCNETARWHIRLLICSPKTLVGLIGGFKMFPSPPTTSYDLPSLDSYESEVLSRVVQPWLRKSQFPAILPWPSCIRPIPYVSEYTSGSNCCVANATRVRVGHSK